MSEIPSEDAVFRVAFSIESPELRAEYLRQVGVHQPAVRDRVNALLEASSEEPDILEPPADSLCQTLELAATVPTVGSRVGPYRLREQIGEGGMGVVFVAEQSEPVRRKVALKVVKPGMATKDVVARFEAERQALAMMNHPSIARAFDGGATDAGQPFFVMELVQGPSITEYCDQQRLTTRERLTLFLQVCQAVDHAHRTGIIHRDLKPSNVLVPEIDGNAVPKVIDFGIAKALGEKLSEATIYTQFSQLIGTPVYMSPAQAGLGVVDVDTRSDVYSLGVLLYELLTGNTPFDRETLQNAGYDEIRRIIREDQPRRPSMLVSTLAAEARSTVAGQRRSDPRRLSDSLRGELDRVAMKALEKDRDRRYESAHALAADVERYLNNEVVTARPPSNFYRLRKFTRRNRALVISVAAVLLALLIGFAIATFGWVAAQRRLTQVIEEQERNQALVAFHREMFGSAYGQDVQSEQTTLRELAERIADELDKGRLQDFPEVDIEIRRTIGGALLQYQRQDRGRASLERALELARKEYGNSHEIVLQILCSLADLYIHEGNLAAAKEVFRGGAQARIERFGDAEHLQVALAELRYGTFLLKHGETNLAKEHLSTAERKLNENPEAAQASRAEAAQQLSVIEAATTDGRNAECVQQRSPG